MKTIITGASGLLGRYLRHNYNGPMGDIIAITHSSRVGGLMHLDLTQEMNVHRLFSDHKPEVIIHCAAMGNVDYAERNPQIAYAMNVDMTERLINLSKDYNPLFVYISSNAVYGGNNPPYNEHSKQRPLSVYGRSKQYAENRVVATCNRHLIIRPFMLFGHNYGMGRPNWLTILREAFKNGRQMKLIDDIIWQPTSADWAAHVIWILIKRALKEEIKNDQFNLSQGYSMSLYAFGDIVQQIWNLDPLINIDLIDPILSSDFPTDASRPIDTSYDIAKLVSVVGESPSVRSEIKSLLGVNNCE